MNQIVIALTPRIKFAAKSERTVPSELCIADKPENRRQFYLVVHAFIFFCVGAGAAARGLAHRSLTGLKTMTLAVCFNPISVSLEDALDDVAIGLETNKFVAQVAA